jgi:hypothetical protein
MGEFTSGLHHLKQARALYDSEHHASYRHQYGQDIGASALCYLSWALWHFRGQSKKALNLLQSVYDQFTEGFDTADLRDAQKLLRTLRRELRLTGGKEAELTAA